MDDTVALAKAVRERGVDVVDCSAGGIAGDSNMPAVAPGPSNQVAFASRVRKEADVKSLAVGYITDPHQAEAILQAGDADLIGIARELMYHADWPIHAAKALGVETHLDMFPPSYAHRLVRREEQLGAGRQS